jgi:replicative DNA helicase
MFDREAHRVVFEAIAALVADDITVDPVTVILRLAETGRLEWVGGAAAVHGLASVDACPVPANWRNYARTVWREADRRRQIEEHLAALRDLGALQVVPA